MDWHSLSSKGVLKELPVVVFIWGWSVVQGEVNPGNHHLRSTITITIKITITKNNNNNINNNYNNKRRDRSRQSPPDNCSKMS